MCKAIKERLVKTFCLIISVTSEMRSSLAANSNDAYSLFLRWLKSKTRLLQIIWKEDNADVS